MPIDNELCARIAAYLDARDDVCERSVVGGLGFTWRGNLVCGVMGDDLLVRVGKARFGELVTRLGARPMIMADRESKAWIVVDGIHVVDHASLASWLDQAVDFTATLPAK